MKAETRLAPVPTEIVVQWLRSGELGSLRSLQYRLNNSLGGAAGELLPLSENGYPPIENWKLDITSIISGE